MNNKFWDNYYTRNNKTLSLAQIIADVQTETKARYNKSESSIFDKSLTDISLYRKDGNWITPYHSKLYNNRKTNGDMCPVNVIVNAWHKQSEYNKEYRKYTYANGKTTNRCLKMELMDFNEAYDVFLNSYLMPAFYNQDKSYEMDKHNEKVIKDLVAYFTRQYFSTLNLKKGICMFGGIGTGKSTIMKKLSQFTKDYELQTAFDFIDMDDVYTGCDTSGLDSLDAYKFRSCCFDDIGMRAENNVNNFGTKINAYRELVRRQYKRFSRPTPSLSHYTTNIQYNNGDYTKDLAKNFGARELDRFREMSNFVPLLGDSRRKY